MAMARKRAKCKIGDVLRDYDTIFIIDKVKTLSGVVVRVFSHTCTRGCSLPGFANVFQAKVLAVLEACQWLRHDLSHKRSIVILMVSQATIKVLTTLSMLVVHSRDTLNSLGGMQKVTLL